jgi:uncharacterized protein
MQLQHETSSRLQIQAYSTTELKINNSIYTNSIIIKNNSVINWPVKVITDLNIIENIGQLFENSCPIIIGHNYGVMAIPPLLLEQASLHTCSIELMSIGAACRTFNILQSDERPVVVGLVI